MKYFRLLQLLILSSVASLATQGAELSGHGAAQQPSSSQDEKVNTTAQTTSADEHRRLLQELQQLKRANRQIFLRIQSIESRLSAAGRGQQSPATGSRTGAPSAESSALATADSGGTVVKKAPDKSDSVANLVLEEHTLFDQKFSVELGYQFSHFDRSQLVLNGFLALDAIFLGQISVDEVEGNISTTTVTTRWGLTDRLQLSLQIPYLFRETTIRSRGKDLSSIAIDEASVDDSALGDISLGFSYRLFPETVNYPDVAWNFRVTAPTGQEPYGIDFIDVPSSGGNLQIPESLPTGTGLWSVSTGLSFLRTTDPAILFAQFEYTHYFKESFSDLDSSPNTSNAPGEVQLGDSYLFGAGIAFAVNEKTSFSLAYTQRIFEETTIKLNGSSTFDVIGSDTTTGTFDIGVTYAFSDRFAMITNLGIGLTTDSSDYSFGVKFPYRF